MPIAHDTLAATAQAYVQAMTRIRGRRVHRLLMREFARFDHVLPARAEDGTPALLALGEDGRAAVCHTNGRGPAATIAEWPRLTGATVGTAYDLLKDSLPTVGWTVSCPAWAQTTGALTLVATGLSPAQQSRLTNLLRQLGR